jgi:ribonucleotide monophosphatase NagD (HAD superfamily)
LQETEYLALRSRREGTPTGPRRFVCSRRFSEDIRAAKRPGARGCLVRTGWQPTVVVEKAMPDACVVKASVAEAVDWILAAS